MLTYEETLAAIHKIPRQKKENNLDRMKMLMTILGQPEQHIPMIHVAGTNGKGSICKMMEEVLMDSGYRVGLFTSPYIVDFRERIQLNENLISKKDLVLYYEKINKATVELAAVGFSTPTEFEVVSAMGFLYFKDQKVDVAIIEVGIGGLYDATNIIMPILSVIASITRDHTFLLGNTIESIARHKAGIIKGPPVISSSQFPEVKKVLQDKARETKSPITFLKSKQVLYLGLNDGKQKIHYDFDDFPLTLELSLLGIHQMLNAGTAILALMELHHLGFTKISEKTIQNSLLQVTWPGRMEIISKEPLIFIDGAHNMDGAISLKESLALYYPNRSLILLLGVLKDKDPEVLVQVLTQGVKMVYFITPNDPRGLKAQELKAMMNSSCPAEVVDSMEEAVEKALRLYTRGDLIFTAGSLYTIGDFKTLFLSQLT